MLQPNRVIVSAPSPCFPGSSLTSDTEPLPVPPTLRIAELAIAFSRAIDLGSSLPPGHSARACILGMRIAGELGMTASTKETLFYALLLAGAGSAPLLGPDTKPDPLVSQTVSLARTLVALSFTPDREEALELVTRDNGMRFERDLVRAVAALGRDSHLYPDCNSTDIARFALDQDSRGRTLADNPALLDTLSRTMAAVVDSRSAFTHNHSQAVAQWAVAIAQRLEIAPAQIQTVRYAALLHDIGKTAVPRWLLQKTGRLTGPEWQLMRSHASHTWHILKVIRGFRQIGEIAASHHERLDGSGYFRGLSAPQLSLEARILMVADVFDALAKDRSYRAALPLDQVLLIMRKSAPYALDGTCLEALEQCLDASGQSQLQNHFFLLS